MTTTLGKAVAPSKSAAASVLRASVIDGTPTVEGGQAYVLIDGADTPVTANGLTGYTPTPGDRLLITRVGTQMEVLQFVQRGTVPYVSSDALADLTAAVASKASILYSTSVPVMGTDTDGNPVQIGLAPDPAIYPTPTGGWPVGTEWVNTDEVQETDENGTPITDDSGNPVMSQPFDQYVYDGTTWQHSQFSFNVNVALGVVSGTVDTHQITLFGDPADPTDTGLTGAVGFTQDQINAFITLMQGVLGYDATNDAWPTPQVASAVLDALAAANPSLNQYLVANADGSFTPKDIATWAMLFLAAHDTATAQDILGVYDATTDIGDYVNANFVNDFNAAL